MNADSLKMQKELFDDFTSGRQAVPLNSYNSPCEQVQLHLLLLFNILLLDL
jgi:hypothetical protein